MDRARGVPGLRAVDWVRPIVLFTSSSYLKTDGQDMPVFDSCIAMAWWLRKWAAGSVLGEPERNRIAWLPLRTPSLLTGLP